ncbi:MFS transporter [Arthrobacter sp. S2(2024)]|uniref:MFS transporter n=1 Tax=Arthrobacter sp. S2(2024) TaxID=3111911 RepID=UPI002FCA9ABA
MNAYRVLFSNRGVARVLSSQLFARLPLGLFSIGILMHVEALTDSFATAGLVVASVSVGQATIMPLASRLAGVVGARRLVKLAASAHAASSVGLALCGPAEGPLIALGLLVGATVPPLMPVVRALYPRIVPPSSVPALFAVDTIIEELIWIIGPVAATLLVASLAPPAPMFACSAITLAGTLWFIASPAIASLSLPRAVSHFGRVLGSRPLLVGMVTSLLLVGSFMALEVAIVVKSDLDPLVAGLAIAMSCLGSLIGGLGFGHRRLGVPGTMLALGVVAAGTALTGLSDNPVVLAAGLLLSGLGFAPALSMIYVMVSRTTAEDATAEAFGWLTTSNLVGGAAGTAMGGLFADVSGTGGVFLFSTALAWLATAAPGLARLGGPLPGLSRSADLRDIPTKKRVK